MADWTPVEWKPDAQQTVSEAIAGALSRPSVLTRWMFVGEVMDEHGTRVVVTISAHDQSLLDTLGLLTWAQVNGVEQVTRRAP